MVSSNRSSPSDLGTAVIAAGPAWQLNPAIQLHWRLLGDEWLLFEALSGQTHHLGSLHAAVLMAFEGGMKLSMVDLVEHLSAHFGLTIDAAATESLESVVQQFAVLGLLVADRPDAAR